jgi:tyrosyl-tRNA synthetase
MGKSESGAIWLDARRTSPYTLYQYLRNIDDDSVLTSLRRLTLLPLEEIAAFENVKGSDINRAKQLLAYEVVRLAHGSDAAGEAQAAAQSLFGGAERGGAPQAVLQIGDFDAAGNISILAVLVRAGLAKSHGEARRLVDQGGVFADERKITAATHVFSREDLQKTPVLLKKGKKGYCQITAE